MLKVFDSLWIKRFGLIQRAELEMIFKRKVMDPRPFVHNRAGGSGKRQAHPTGVLGRDGEKGALEEGVWRGPSTAPQLTPRRARRAKDQEGPGAEWSPVGACW